MLIVTFIATVNETLSFIIDAQVLSFIFYNISQIQLLQLAQTSSDIIGVYS